MIDLMRDTLLSVNEVAIRLQVTPKTVYVWADSGVRGRVLETVKVGGKRITSVEALQRFTEHKESPVFIPMEHRRDDFNARQQAAIKTLMEM